MSKFDIIIAALNFAKEEVEWYFLHADYIQQNDKGRKLKKEIFALDYSIFELIHLCQQMGEKLLGREAGIVMMNNTRYHC